MTAREAREMASSLKNENTAEDIRKAEKAIESAAKAGKFTITINKLCEQAQNYLKLQGFKLESFSDFRDGDYHQISW